MTLLTSAFDSECLSATFVISSDFDINFAMDFFFLEDCCGFARAELPPELEHYFFFLVFLTFLAFFAFFAMMPSSVCRCARLEKSVACVQHDLHLIRQALYASEPVFPVGSGSICGSVNVAREAVTMSRGL
jgi:hypothetical protein